MNKDFRVSVTLPTHPKALKLMRKLGDRSFYNLIRFWAFVSQNKPNGDLSGYDEDDIEIAADWIGAPGEFINTLLDPKIRFLEKTDDGFFVHDWLEHNEYASHAQERSEKAKKAAKARWEKGSGKQPPAHSNAKTCYEHKSSNTTSINKQCPSPYQYPSHSPVINQTYTLNSKVIFTEISKILPIVDGFFKKRGQIFDSRKWAVQQFRNKGHPGAILETFKSMINAKFEIDNPNGIANHIFKRENGNFNEKDFIKMQEEWKNMKPGELSKLTDGLFQEI